VEKDDLGKIMTLDSFILWKFKRLEGRLKGFRSSDMYLTKIDHGLEQYELAYDIKTNTAKLTNAFDGHTMFECSFKELEQYLGKLGLLVERDMSERHSSSAVPMEFKL
jgi:hypothetical protein